MDYRALARKDNPFDGLSEEEKLGKTPKYTIKAYDKDGNLAKGTNGYYIETKGDSSPTFAVSNKFTRLIFFLEHALNILIININ